VQHILAKAGNQIGIAIAGLINLFNQGMIVLGGGLARSGDLLLEPMHQVVQARHLPASTCVVQIITSLLRKLS
jgi:predicted NBD/HSP70 family sugar kinase